MNAATAAKIAAAPIAPVLYTVPRPVMIQAYLDAATAYCLYLLRTQGSRNDDHVRDLAADVVSVGRQMTAMGYRYDDEALLNKADARAYHLVYGNPAA